jgi:hypothetical protein
VLPVPDKVTVVGEFTALLVITSVPLADPEAVGLNVALSARLALGFKVKGGVAPATANGPEVEKALTVRD